MIPEPGGPGGPLAPPIFGRSVNPIPTGEGRLSPPITTGTPNVFQLPASLRNRTKSLYSLRDSQGRERPNIKNACLPCSNISSNSMTNYGPPDMHYTAPAPTASSTYSSQLEDQKGSSLSHSSYNSHYGTLPRPRKHSSQYSEAEKSGIVVSSYATLPRQRRWVG